MNQYSKISKLTCLRCEHTWINKTNRKPKACPNPTCKSRIWDKPRQRRVRILGNCKLCGKKVTFRRKKNIWGDLVPTWKYSEDNIFHEKCHELYKKSLHKTTTYEYHTPPSPVGKFVIKR